MAEQRRGMLVHEADWAAIQRTQASWNNPRADVVATLSRRLSIARRPHLMILKVQESPSCARRRTF